MQPITRDFLSFLRNVSGFSFISEASSSKASPLIIFPLPTFILDDESLTRRIKLIPVLPLATPLIASFDSHS